MKPEGNEKKTKRNLFRVCFPCFGKSAVDCDEVMYNSFGKEFTEYEYVIENLAIRKAPKALLDSVSPAKSRKNKSKYGQTEKPKRKHFGSLVAKKIPPEIAVGPVVEVEDVPQKEEILVNPVLEEQTPNVPNTPTKPKFNPCYLHLLPDPIPNRPVTSFSYNVKTEQDDNVAKKTLNCDLYGPGLIRPETLPKTQVLADIHPVKEADNFTLDIPAEIQETIDALKVARPTHPPVFPPLNHRILMSDESIYSCNKETVCDLLEMESVRNEAGTSSSEITYRRKHSSKCTKYRKRSVSPGEDTNPIEVVDNDIITPIVEHKLEQSKHKNLKWKIIINKHNDKKT